MNRKMVFYMIGRIMTVEAFLMLLPSICALIYKEECVYAFLISASIALGIGILLTVLNRNADKIIFAKEGFAIVALAWVTLAAVGALPFVISEEIPSYTDAFFEIVSGFTTTGSSILKNVESMSKGLLFWRSFSHWVGGMGILVLVMAIVPTNTGRAMHIFRAEMPGPIIGKLVPKAKSTAKILYLMYIVLTVLQVILMCFGGMPLFESLVHTFGTAGTGGFGIKADSIGGYSPYLQWVIAIFMLIFGVNFNIYFLLIMRKFRSAFKSEELWTYIGIVSVASGVIALNIYNQCENISEALRTSVFQVASIISTTGYATTDFNLWPTLSKSILFVIMWIGACAGSTAGGFKLSRVVLLFKQVRANLKHTVHSRSVEAIRFEGKKVDSATITNVCSYLAVYIICFAIFFLLISFEPFSLETNLSAAVTCFNNVGPGFDAVGPAANFANYSAFSKWVLSAAMLFGRLEIFPMLILFSPSNWIKNREILKR